MAQVFISYARKDQDAALGIYEGLTREGYDAWMDVKNLVAGQDWAGEIDAAIHESEIFVACLSEHSVSKRGYFQAELKKALDVLGTIPEDEVYFVPVRLDECDPPRKISGLHWHNYFAKDGPETLIQTIGALLSKRAKREASSEKETLLNRVRGEVKESIKLMAALMSHSGWDCNFAENYMSGNEFEMVSTQFVELAESDSEKLAMLRGSLHFGRNMERWLPVTISLSDVLQALSAATYQTHRRPGYRAATVVECCFRDAESKALLMKLVDARGKEHVGSRMLTMALEGRLRDFFDGEFRSIQPENAGLALGAYDKASKQIRKQISVTPRRGESPLKNTAIDEIRAVRKHSEDLATRCKDGLLRSDEAKVDLQSLHEQIESVLPADSDAYRVFERFRRENPMAWSKSMSNYVNPKDFDNFAKLTITLDKVLRHLEARSQEDKPDNDKSGADDRRGQNDRSAHNWDVFICHASEDKTDVVEPLAVELNKRGLKVWYDRWILNIGDSLRRKIDEGLINSRFGIVILSPRFFEKEWPQRELDGLTQREIEGKKVILPVWHDVMRDDVLNFSPVLADRVAGSTRGGISELARALARAITGGSGEPSEAERPDTPDIPAGVTVGYDEVDTTNRLHRYSLNVEVTLNKPPDQGRCSLRLLWPETVRLSRLEGFTKGQEREQEEWMFCEYKYEHGSRIWPGETAMIVGGVSSGRLEYEYDDEIWGKLEEKPTFLYYTLHLEDHMPVEGKVAFSALNCY